MIVEFGVQGKYTKSLMKAMVDILLGIQLYSTPFFPLACTVDDGKEAIIYRHTHTHKCACTHSRAHVHTYAFPDSSAAESLNKQFSHSDAPA